MLLNSSMAVSKKTSSEVLQQYQKLIEQVEHHNRLYHTLDKPEITDYEYDQIFQKLLDFEKSHPELDTSNSPSKKTGAIVLDAFQKAAHRKPMLSLSNSYNEEEIIAFDEKVRKFLSLPENNLEYFAELKLDGLSIELIYEGGILVRALTRGDGLVGEDVTHNVLTIKSIPKKIKHSSLLEVRGEILIFKNDFLDLNQQQEENGLSHFANPRNAAAGAIRQLDSGIAAQRPLKFFAYALGDYQDIQFQSQEEIESTLHHLGFPVLDKKYTCKSNQIDSIIKFYKKIESEREHLPFDIDGIVIKVNSLKQQDDLGLIARSPRWATATKFKPTTAETQIENIVVQVGRTGALTPVAIVKPTKVGGVTISHATLHNQDEIDRKNIRIGDYVYIQRAGDVIPEITEVILSKRPERTAPFRIPANCPVCSSKAVKEEGEVISRCSNPKCQAVIIESIKHFISRRAMNIEKVGDKLIESLVNKKIVSCFSDLYLLNTEKISLLERQGEKSISNILTNIEKSKQTTLSKFIYALGIRFIGEQTAKLLADHFLTIENFLKAEKSELETIPEIGPKVSESILSFLSKPECVNEVRKLLQAGIMLQASQRKLDGKLSGKSFLVTGTLPVKRDEAHSLIEQNGGKLLSSVSSKLSYLVVGDDPGSKIEKARSLDVKIISWDELLKMIS